jgi:peptidoglycan hydrolase-like protein with peptidoglycan-binding domain
LFFLIALVIWAGSVNVQAQMSADPAKTSEASKPKRGPVFRPTKDQIMQVQGMLAVRQLYNGEPSGRYDDATRAGIKSFQKGNGLRETGTLNRATLEKFGVELTDSQRAIPVDPKSFASADDGKPKKEKAEKSGDKPKKAAPFRATAEQLTALQRVLRSENLFTGEANGKRSEEFKAAVKKYQAAKGLNATGGVNADTLKAAGVELTDKQKGQN